MFVSNLSPEDKKNFLELAYFVSNCDDDIHTEEVRILARLREELELSVMDYEIEKRSIEKVIDSLSKSDLKSKKAMFLEIMNLIMSDEKYNESEMRIAEKIAGAWGLIPDESMIVLKWIKDLYKS